MRARRKAGENFTSGLIGINKWNNFAHEDIAIIIGVPTVGK